jgi:hypothetical protein
VRYLQKPSPLYIRGGRQSFGDIRPPPDAETELRLFVPADPQRHASHICILGRPGHILEYIGATLAQASANY